MFSWQFKNDLMSATGARTYVAEKRLDTADGFTVYNAADWAAWLRDDELTFIMGGIATFFTPVKVEHNKQGIKKMWTVLDGKKFEVIVNTVPGRSGPEYPLVFIPEGTRMYEVN